MCVCVRVYVCVRARINHHLTVRINIKRRGRGGDIHTDRQTDRQTDRLTDRYTDRQTDT